MISIEKVLNSRCSCDFDGNPKNDHWGMFAENKHPSQEKLQVVLECCNAPQFSDGKLLHWFKDEYLFLGFEKVTEPFEMRLLHIESGMQQEAVYLACTALALGTCIFNMGINGTENDDKMLTVRHLILENIGSYGTEKFSTSAPGPENPFKKGKNLSEPKRDGSMQCLSELRQLTLSKNIGIQADETDVSQMLWAAKGRTPHYVKSHPWGLTIPTYGGGQNYTDIYLFKKNKLFRYVNWTTPLSECWWIVGNPTHDIKPEANVNISSELDDANIAIIVSRNEETNRALWEVGYMIENMLLQAKSLGISYKTKVFTSDEMEKLKMHGLSDAVAALLL
jgi:hypothetical protein